jgi:hypothetical protein
MATIPAPVNLDHAGAVAYLRARRAAYLESATTQTELAARLLADGDPDAAAELITGAKQAMARVAAIDSARRPA